MSNDVLLYAQVRDAFGKTLEITANDPFIQELYAFIDASSIIPLIQKDGAFILVNNDGIKPIWLIRTQHIDKVIKLFPNNIKLTQDIIAFSREEVPLKKYIGRFSKTIESELKKQKTRYSFIKIFIRLNQLPLATPSAKTALFMLNKKNKWKIGILIPEASLKNEYFSSRDFAQNIFPKKDDFDVFFHNIRAKSLFDIRGIGPYPISNNAKNYALNNIFTKISSHIDFGFYFSKKENEAPQVYNSGISSFSNGAKSPVALKDFGAKGDKNTYFFAFQLLDSRQEDVFIENLRYFFAYAMPEYDEKILLDGTRVYEEVIKPEKYTFTLLQKSMGLYSLNYNKEEVWYYQSDGKKILLSNDLGLIQYYAKKSDQKKSLECIRNDSEKYIIVKSSFIKKYIPILQGWEYLDRDMHFDLVSEDFISGCII